MTNAATTLQFIEKAINPDAVLEPENARKILRMVANEDNSHITPSRNRTPYSPVILQVSRVVDMWQVLYRAWMELRYPRGACQKFGVQWN